MTCGGTPLLYMQRRLGGDNRNEYPTGAILRGRDRDPSMKLKLFSFLVILMLIALVGCDGPEIPTSGTYTFSFERDMEEWVAKGTDLDNPPVEWSIERSDDIASDGNTAVRLYLNNLNDAGKIWIQRQFDTEPNRTYCVHLKYDFASADWGDLNLWTIITSASPLPPVPGLLYQGDTGNSARPEDGFVWLHKGYDFDVTSGSDGKVYIVIGVWGTWETARTYYLDNVGISFTARK
jgi:hypothetical protein